MMKKNKWIGGAVSMMILGTMELPVHAEDRMEVTYREPNAYTVTIPTVVDLRAGATSNEIAVPDVNLEPGKEIKIKISNGVDASGTIKLSRENDTNTKVVTTISTTEGGTGIALNNDFATFTADGEQALYYSEITAESGGQVRAGNYSGTITFTVTAPEKN